MSFSKCAMLMGAAACTLLAPSAPWPRQRVRTPRSWSFPCRWIVSHVRLFPSPRLGQLSVRGRIEMAGFPELTHLLTSRTDLAISKPCAAKVALSAIMSVTGWADAHNDQQPGLYVNDAVRHDVNAASEAFGTGAVSGDPAFAFLPSPESPLTSFEDRVRPPTRTASPYKSHPFHLSRRTPFSTTRSGLQQPSK